MMPEKSSKSDQLHRSLTTDELASIARTKPQTIRKRLCQTGSYFGVKPQKLPNGKLLWPDDSLEQLIKR